MQHITKHDDLLGDLVVNGTPECAVTFRANHTRCSFASAKRVKQNVLRLGVGCQALSQKMHVST
jgi:hypothetical protein